MSWLRPLAVLLSLLTALSFTAAPPVEAAPRRDDGGLRMGRAGGRSLRMPTSGRQLRMPQGSPGLRMTGTERGVRPGVPASARVAPLRGSRSFAPALTLRERGRSYGLPQDGALSDAVRLPRTRGIHIRRPDRAYGTGEIIWHLITGVTAVKRAFPGTKDIAVGDLSWPTGGPMRGHKSHQSGLDADIAFYTKGQSTQRHFRDATPETLDAARTWVFIETLLEQGRVQFLFIDYSLQAVLYEYARAHAAPRWRSSEALARVFQYPLPPWLPVGIIRHEPNHLDHIHIRVHAPEREQHLAAR